MSVFKVEREIEFGIAAKTAKRSKKRRKNKSFPHFPHGKNADFFAGVFAVPLMTNFCDMTLKQPRFPKIRKSRLLLAVFLQRLLLRFAVLTA